MLGGLVTTAGRHRARIDQRSPWGAIEGVA